MEEHDAVNHPEHYCFGDIEVIDIIEALNLPYHLGNAVKYLARFRHKGKPVEDLRKAVWYIERYIEMIKRDERLDEIGKSVWEGIIRDKCEHRKTYTGLQATCGSAGNSHGLCHYSACPRVRTDKEPTFADAPLKHSGAAMSPTNDSDSAARYTWEHMSPKCDHYYTGHNECALCNFHITPVGECVDCDYDTCPLLPWNKETTDATTTMDEDGGGCGSDAVAAQVAEDVRKYEANADHPDNWPLPDGVRQAEYGPRHSDA